MTAPAAFTEMRRALIVRGLLTADFALTEAGHAHCQGLIDSYRLQEVRVDHGSPVKWNMKGRFGSEVAR